ncbi:MAG: 4Fe-4S dicluster domain-containing protein [Marinilabiliaceae bacterium]|jgi:ferredoxin|nr:4Fe-4S dicluster domain-containing protein [Marinilabiliaceae bacterium]
MAIRVDDNFKKELVKFGAGDWNHCFHCGNCTAECPLTEDRFIFPRRSIRLVQLGLVEKMETSLDPWLCYYCGDCSVKCPQDANPAELMMSMRRWLTSVYDWTGLSRKFYTTKIWELGFIAGFAVLILALFAWFLPPASDLFSNPGRFVNEQGGVMINSLAEGVSGEKFLHIIHIGDWIMAAIIAFLLVTNIFNMFLKTIVKDKLTIPLYMYFTEFWHLIYNFVTQKNMSKCEKKNYWIFHLFLMTGYTIMFIVVVALLPKFQTEEVHKWYHWQRILGYYATIGIMIFLVYSAIGRIKKEDIKFKFSHPSDWLYIVMLGLTVLSGIVLHAFRLLGMPGATYIMFVLHMAILVPMLVVEVPFSKWSHLAYRPFAAYFHRLKKSAYKKSALTNPAFAV